MANILRILTSPRHIFRWKIVLLLLGTVMLLLGGLLAVCSHFHGRAIQVADPFYSTKIEKPAFCDRHPSVLLDEAHYNIHTAAGTYKPFVDLMTNDGYNVTINRQPFSSGSLERYDIIVIAGARCSRRSKDRCAAISAFSTDEQKAVLQWVQNGGGLLITADHPPLGTAVAELLYGFGIEGSGGHTIDVSPEKHLKRSLSPLVFSRENGLLGNSPVTNGTQPGDRVEKIISCTGNSFLIPSGGFGFLHCSPTAWEVFTDEAIKTPEQFTSPPSGLMYRPSISAAGRVQGVAVRIGKGRVVALGDGSMLTAMYYGKHREPKGMNMPGNDARQVTINIMHWLSGLYDQ